uniref:Uncharacterized protein n=1 Tax=viral metagenome TaxID=1070528 RepID=A0A6C0D271_9ZZZZ
MENIDKYIPVSILGCPIEFSVSAKYVFLDTVDVPQTIRTLLAPGRIFTHPILGNMSLEFMETNHETGHITKVFCQLLDNKRRQGNYDKKVYSGDDEMNL